MPQGMRLETLLGASLSMLRRRETCQKIKATSSQACRARLSKRFFNSSLYLSLSPLSVSLPSSPPLSLSLSLFLSFCGWVGLST